MDEETEGSKQETATAQSEILRSCKRFKILRECLHRKKREKNSVSAQESGDGRL